MIPSHNRAAQSILYASALPRATAFLPDCQGHARPCLARFLASGHNSTTPRCWHRAPRILPLGQTTGGQMFTRSNSGEPKRLEPVNSNAGSSPNIGANAGLNVPQRRPVSAEAGPKSVIGNDLKIIGQGLKIIS